MTARDLLLSKRLPGNTFDQQAAAQRALAELANREIIVPQLSGIAQDFGLVNAGTIVMGNGQPLGAGFTGVMQFADPLEWPTGSGSYWHYIGFNTDVMMFGISAADGKLYAAGGKMAIDSAAISMNDLLYALTQTAVSSASVHYYSRFGMSNSEGGEPKPSWEYTSEPDTNLLANPDFETGTFTNWTVSSESWSVVTTPVHGGSYAARVVNSGAGAQIGVLVSDQFAVTGRTDYEVSAWYRHASGVLLYYGGRVQIEWYDAASGGNYIKTSQLLLPFTEDQWLQGKGIVTSPGNALGAKVRLYLATLGSGVAYFDDVAFGVVSPSTRIVMEPDVHIRGADLYVEDNKVPAGDVASYALIAQNATMQQTVYSRLIEAGKLGSNGSISVAGSILLHTTGGTARSMNPLEFNFGGTTLFSYSTVTAGTARYVQIEFIFHMVNTGSPSTQRATIILWERNNPSTTVVSPITNSMISVNDAPTVNTSTDQTFYIYVTPSGTGQDLIRHYIAMDGPNYA